MATWAKRSIRLFRTPSVLSLLWTFQDSLEVWRHVCPREETASVRDRFVERGTEAEIKGELLFLCAFRHNLGKPQYSVF